MNCSTRIRPIWVHDVSERHQVTRVRRETRRRTITVAATERLTPHMLRLNFTSDDFDDFDSAGPDDHIKLFLADAAGERVARDYTPRAFDRVGGTLVIDFALHDAGPATRWALSATRGDTIEIGGPRGSTIIADDFDWYLLIGDETALPSIARRLEELRPGVPVTAVIAIDGPKDRLEFSTRAALTLAWSERAGSAAPDDARLRALVAGLPAGDGFVWIAAEAGVARAMRSHVVDTLEHPRGWCKASGYWSAGKAGAHDKIGD